MFYVFSGNVLRGSFVGLRRIVFDVGSSRHRGERRMFLVFSGKGMTGSFGHLRRGVSHAGLSKASGGARWKIQNSSRGSRCCKQDTVACQVADFSRLVRLGFFRILWAQHVSGLGSSCRSS